MTSRVRSRVLSLFLAGLVPALLLLPAAPARAESAVRYAALGDSYSAGVGAPPYDPASGSCNRSPQGYPALWAATRSPAAFAFVACGGATTGTVLASQLGAVNRTTSLVTITVGGNDVGFVAVVGTCTVGSTSACSTAVNAARTLATTVLPAQLTATYLAIRLRAPRARLVVLGYPRLFETSATCAAPAPSQANRVTLNAGADTLNAVLAARAAALGATFVGVADRFAGHGVCGADPWINAPGADVTGSYHPNATGYREGYLAALASVTG
jgi:lysophospholipase L1-like esterase